MLDKLTADFDSILELVKKAPTALQETALKTILENWFSANAGGRPTPSTMPAAANVPVGGTAGGTPAGLPDAIKPFLTANAITLETLEKVFHPAGAGAQLLAADIPGNGKANKMVSLALLLCVRQALDSGSFTCTLKSVREMAVHYDCYDSANFSGTLKSNKNYFKPRDKGADLDLSGPGMKRAGEIIKAVATGD